MKVQFVAACFLLTFITWGVSSSFFPEIPSPVFLWSGNNYFTSKSSQYIETTYSNQIVELVTSMLNNQVKTSIINSNVNPSSTRPEMIVMYVASSKEFHPQSYKHIQPVVTGAQTSLIMPYNYHQNTVPSFSFVEAVTNAEQKHSLIVSQEENDQVISDKFIFNKNLISHLTENKSTFFKTGESSLLIVYLPQTNGLEFVKSVDQKVSELSQGNYVALLTSDYGVEHLSKTIETVHSQIAVMQRDVVATASDSFWPAPIWEALMVSIVMLLMLFVGVFCTATVQTPQRWGSTKYVCQFTEISDP